MSGRANLTLLVAALLVALGPLILNAPTEYDGTDSLAQAEIERGGYQPWAQSLWAPPGPAVESLLFAAQAALGAGVLGYVLGRRQGKKDGR